MKFFYVFRRRLLLLKYVLIFAIVLQACEQKKEQVWQSLQVKVTAYNSVISQTDNQPNLAAWGDTLRPGMKVIAVSRDLIALGLKHNTKVRIEGLPDVYWVKDKMNARYQNRIDIYMGTDIEKAKKWGQKKLSIQYVVIKDSTNLSTQ